MYKDPQFRLKSQGKFWEGDSWTGIWDLIDEQELSSKEKEVGWKGLVQSSLSWEEAYAEAIKRGPCMFQGMEES